MTIETGDDLEPFRGYLQVLAELHLDRRLRGKLDPSEIVQQTMLRAYSAFSELRSRDSEVLMAWLRRFWRARWPMRSSIMNVTSGTSTRSDRSRPTSASSFESARIHPTHAGDPRPQIVNVVEEMGTSV